MYVLIHLGNINNSEREYKGREKKCVGNKRKGRQNLTTPNSGKRTRGDGRGGGRGWGESMMGTDGLSTGCYSVCGQIEHQ